MKLNKSFLLLELFVILSVVFVACSGPGTIIEPSSDNQVNSQLSYPGPEQSAVAVPTPTTQSPPSNYPAPWTPIANPIPSNNCSFTLTNVTATPGNLFSVSEPLILFSTSDGLYVYEWLPDDMNLLIGRAYQASDSPFYRTVEILDLGNGQTTLYVDEPFAHFPVWMPEKQAVVYRGYATGDPATSTPALWMSLGDPQNPELIAENIPENFSMNVDFQWFFFSSQTGNELQRLDLSTKTMQTTLIDPTKWQSQYFSNPQAVNQEFRLEGFQSAWRPDNAKLLIYQFPVNYLYEAQQETYCEIYLGEMPEQGYVRPIKALWSPDGRYLALLVTASYSSTTSAPFAKLMILDLVESSQKTLTFDSVNTVADIAWSPDSQHLALLNVVEQTEQIHREGLYLLHVSDAIYQQVLPSYQFGGSQTPSQMAWSHNGSQIAVTCPVVQNGEWIERQICLVSLNS